jgi:hypothetical protein
MDRDWSARLDYGLDTRPGWRVRGRLAGATVVDGGTSGAAG